MFGDRDHHHRKGGKTVIDYGHRTGSGRKVKKVRRGEDVHGGGGGIRGEEERDDTRWNNNQIRRNEEPGGVYPRPPNRVPPPAPIISRNPPVRNPPRTPPQAPPAPNISGQKRSYYDEEEESDRHRAGPFRGGPYRGGPYRGGQNPGWHDKRARYDNEQVNHDRRYSPQPHDHGPGPSYASSSSYSNNSYNNNSNKPREPERFQVPKPDCPLPATIQISNSPSSSSGSPEVVDGPSSPDDGDDDIVVVDQVKKPSSDSSSRSSNTVEAPGPRPKSHLAQAGTLRAFREPSRRPSQENRRSNTENRRSSTENKRPVAETRRSDIRSSSSEQQRRHERRRENQRSGSAEKRSSGHPENRRPESNETRNSTENRASSSAERRKDAQSSRPGDRNDRKADSVRRNSTEERRSSNDSQRSSSSADPRNKIDKDPSSCGKAATEKDKDSASKTSKQVSENSKSGEKAGETSGTVAPNETSKGGPSKIQLLEKLVSKPGIKEKILESVKKQLSRSTSHETKKTDVQQGSSSSVSGGSQSVPTTPVSREKPEGLWNTSTERTTVSASVSQLAPGKAVSQPETEVSRKSSIASVPKPVLEKVPQKDIPVNKVTPSNSVASQPKAGEQVRGDASRNAVPEVVPSTANVCETVPIIRPVPLSQITRAIPVDPTKISPSTANNITGMTRSRNEVSPNGSRTEVANKQNRPTPNQQKTKPTTAWANLEREASLARAKLASKQPAFASNDELLNTLLGKDDEEESAAKSSSETTGASDKNNVSEEAGGNSQSSDPSFLRRIAEGDSSPVLPINYNYEIPIPGLDIPPANEQGSSSVPETAPSGNSATEAFSVSKNSTALNPPSVTPRLDKPTTPCSSSTPATSTSQTTSATSVSKQPVEPAVSISVTSKNPKVDSVVSADVTRSNAAAQRTEIVSSAPKSKDTSSSIPELLESQPEKITESPQKLAKLRVNLQLDGSTRNPASGNVSKSAPCDSDSVNSTTSAVSNAIEQQETSRRLETVESVVVGNEDLTSGVLSDKSVKEASTASMNSETQSGADDGRERDLAEGTNNAPQSAVTVQQKESTGTGTQVETNMSTEKEPTPPRVQQESISVRSTKISTPDAIQSTPEKQQTRVSPTADGKSLPATEQPAATENLGHTNSVATSVPSISNADTTQSKSSTAAVEELTSSGASTQSETASTPKKTTTDAAPVQEKRSPNDQQTSAPVSAISESLLNPVIVEPESGGSVAPNIPVIQGQQSEGDAPLDTADIGSINKASKSSTDAAPGLPAAEVPISREPNIVSPMEEAPSLVVKTISNGVPICSSNVMPETPPLLPLAEEPMEIDIPRDSVSDEQHRESATTEEIEEGELIMSDSPLLTPPASSEPSTASIEHENALLDGSNTAVTTEHGGAGALSPGNTAVVLSCPSLEPGPDDGGEIGDKSTANTSLASVPLCLDTNVPAAEVRALSSNGSHQDYPVLRIFGNTADIGVQVDMTVESSSSGTESNSIEGIKIRNDVLSSSPPSSGEPDLPVEPTEETKVKEAKTELFDRFQKHLGRVQQVINSSASDERLTFTALEEILNGFLAITEQQFSIIDELKDKSFVISHPSSNSPAAADPANPPVLDPLSLVTVDEMSEYFQALLLIDSVPKRRSSSLQDTLGVHRHRICRILHYLCSLRPGREEASVMNVVNLLYQKFHKLFPNQEPAWTREHVTRCWDAVRLFSGEIDERAIKLDHKGIGPEGFLKKAKMLVQKVQAENKADPANILPAPPPYTQPRQVAAVPTIAPTAAAQLLRPLSPITPPTVNNIPQGVVQNSQPGILASRLAEGVRQSDTGLSRLNQQQQVQQQGLQQQHQQQPQMQAMSPELVRRLSSSQDVVTGMPSPHGSITQQLQHVVQSIPSPQMQMTHTVHHPGVNMQRQVQNIPSPGAVAQGPLSPFSQMPNIPSPQGTIPQRLVGGTPSPHSEAQGLQFSPSQPCCTSQGQPQYFSNQVPEGQQQQNNVHRQQQQHVQRQGPQGAAYQMTPRQAQQLLQQQQHQQQLLQRQMQQPPAQQQQQQQIMPRQMQMSAAQQQQQQQQIMPRQTQLSAAQQQQQQQQIMPRQTQLSAAQQQQQQQQIMPRQTQLSAAQQQQQQQQQLIQMQTQQPVAHRRYVTQEQYQAMQQSQQMPQQPEVRLQQQQYVQSVPFGSSQGQFMQSSVPVEQGGTLQVHRLQSDVVQSHHINITHVQAQIHTQRQYPQVMASNQGHGSVIAQQQPRPRSRHVPAQQATYPAATSQAQMIHQQDVAVNQQNSVVAPTSTSSAVANNSNSFQVTVGGAGGKSFVIPFNPAGTNTNAAATTQNQQQQIHPTVRQSSLEGQGFEQLSNSSDSVVNSVESIPDQQLMQMINEPSGDDFIRAMFQQ